MKKAIILLSALPLAANAQTKLTIDDCVALAKERNNAIVAATHAAESAAYDARSAKANFLPSISATGSGIYSTAKGSYTSNSGMLPVFAGDGTPIAGSAYFPGINLEYEVGPIYSAGIKIEQPIYTGGKISNAYRMAETGKEIASENRRRIEADIIVETCKAYANVVQAKEKRAVAESYRSLLTELMRRIEKARDRGAATLNDILKVEVRLNESELMLQRADNAIRLATMNLCHYTGLPLEQEIETDSTLAIGTPTVANGSIQSRPEYSIYSKKSEISRRQIALARSEILPQIGISGQYGYTHGIKLNGNTLLDDTNFTAAVQLIIPLFKFGKSMNKIRSAKAAYARSKAEEENINELLLLELTKAENNLMEAEAELKLAEKNVASNEENLRASNRRYAAGSETLSNLLEAQLLWQQARQQLADSRINRYIAWVEYRKAIGQLN